MIVPPRYYRWPEESETVGKMYGLDGYSIIEEPRCVKSEEHTVTRSWRERLFSWPWRPWRVMRTVTVQVADENIYVWGGTIICHPMVAQQLKDALPLKEAALTERYG